MKLNDYRQYDHVRQQSHTYARQSAFFVHIPKSKKGYSIN